MIVNIDRCVVDNGSHPKVQFGFLDLIYWILWNETYFRKNFKILKSKWNKNRTGFVSNPDVKQMVEDLLKINCQQHSRLSFLAHRLICMCPLYLFKHRHFTHFLTGCFFLEFSDDLGIMLTRFLNTVFCGIDTGGSGLFSASGGRRPARGWPRRQKCFRAQVRRREFHPAPQPGSEAANIWKCKCANILVHT